MLRPLTTLGPLRDPVLIAGFAGQLNGGTVAATVQYLVEQWRAEPVAELDPEECFDFTVRRPLVRVIDGVRTLEWPANSIYVARPPGVERDFVLVPGLEPNLRWRGFCDALAECVKATGCRSAVLLDTRAGAVPHTRATPLRLMTTTEAFGRAFGIEPTVPVEEGPIGIGTVLAEHLAATGVEVARLTAMTPFYVIVDPNAHAMLAFVEAIDAAFGTSTLVSQLRDAGAEIDHATNGAVYGSEQFAAMVRSIEQQFDWIRSATPTKASHGEHAARAGCRSARRRPRTLPARTARPS